MFHKIMLKLSMVESLTMTACMANLTFINTFVVIEQGGTVNAVLSVVIAVCENDFLLFVKKLFIYVAVPN